MEQVFMDMNQALDLWNKLSRSALVMRVNSLATLTDTFVFEWLGDRARITRVSCD